MKDFNYDSYMRHNPLMKEADENQDASIELEFATAEKKPDFQKDLKVYGIKVEPSGDKKKKYSGQKDDLHAFVTKNWGMATAKSIDETSGYGNYTTDMLENDSLNLGPDQKMMEDSVEKYPRIALEKAALAAKDADIEREEAVTIVNQAYGKGMQAYGEKSMSEAEDPVEDYEIDFAMEFGKDLEALKDTTMFAKMTAQKNGDQNWTDALDRITSILDQLEDYVNQKSRKLGVIKNK